MYVSEVEQLCVVCSEPLHFPPLDINMPPTNVFPVAAAANEGQLPPEILRKALSCRAGHTFCVQVCS